MEAGGAETEPNVATKNQDGPLSGIRVLDVTQWYSGPWPFYTSQIPERARDAPKISHTCTQRTSARSLDSNVLVM